MDDDDDLIERPDLVDSGDDDDPLGFDENDNDSDDNDDDEYGPEYDAEKAYRDQFGQE